MNNLGQIYLFGFGALLDYGRAFDLHMAAAEAGNPVARWNVAIAFSDGFGVDANPVEADNWRTWTPPEGITPDLMEPTLARTLLFGSTLSETERANLRRATELGEPVTMTTRPKSVSPYSTNFPIVAPKLQD